LVDGEHRLVVDVVPRLDVLDAPVDRKPHRAELKRRGDAFPACIPANPRDSLPEKPRIVEGSEHVGNAEISTVLVDRHEERVQKSVRGIDVVTTEFLKGMT